MKNDEHPLQAKLTEALQARLGGLNEKHAAKLLKAIARAAKDLANAHAKFVRKDLKVKAKSKDKATEKTPAESPLPIRARSAARSSIRTPELQARPKPVLKTPALRAKQPLAKQPA